MNKPISLHHVNLETTRIAPIGTFLLNDAASHRLTANKVDLVGSNEPARTPRVAIVGTGLVGATTAYSLLLSGLSAQIVLINRDKDRARAHVDDLRDAELFSHTSQIILGDFSACCDCDIVVMTVGVSQSSVQVSRLENLQEAAAIFRTVIPHVAARNPSAILLIASNPVDVLTYAAWKWSGFPVERVIGSGTSLDTSRLRRRLAEHYDVAPDNVHAYVVGEHGHSQVALLSSATIAGVPLAEFSRRREGPVSEAALAEIAESARTGGLDILRAKGATNYGIAAALVRIIRAILRDERAVLTVSSVVPRRMGLGELCLSLPTILDRRGINDVVAPTMASHENRALKRSAHILKQHIETVPGLAAAAAAMVPRAPQSIKSA
jgi:L-lactate dehydrogenase